MNIFFFGQTSLAEFRIIFVSLSKQSFNVNVQVHLKYTVNFNFIFLKTANCSDRPVCFTTLELLIFFSLPPPPLLPAKSKTK